MGQGSSTPQAFDKPWRTVNWSDREPMLKTLREFQSNGSVDHLRILVVGPADAGKSTFITSVNTVLQGRNTYLAHSLTGGSSVTSKYTVYKLNKGTEGSFFPFVFGDTMGLKKDSYGAHTKDIVNILKGHVPEGYTFDPSKELTSESNDFNRTPSLNDKVHCLVFVLPADTIDKMHEEINTKMKETLKKAHDLGIPVVVIVSKVDEACSIVKEDLKMIYRSKKIKESMEKCSVRVGVPLNYIFPVKNYHMEINNHAEIDILILMALTNIVNFANDFKGASEKPWRQVDWSDREPMLKTLREFQSNQSVDHLRILVVGPEGAGKSTFITSVNTALQGRNTYLAHSVRGGFSATSKYTVYKLNKSTEGSFFPFVFGDTMGLYDAHTKDIINILQGHVREGYTFDPLRELTDANKYFNKTPSLNDKVHCLVFVLPANTISHIPDKIYDKIKQILEKAHELGISVVVIVSKVDEACPLIQQNLEMIYRSKKIKESMEECSVRVGVSLTCIFPVKSYHMEINNHAEIDILILIALRNIVNFANDFVERNV